MNRRLPQLDGFRILLCLTVVTSHWLGSSMGWVNYNFVNAYLSVDGFFILSGFVLSWVYAGRIESGSIGIARFFLHRFARLYPLHLLTLLVSIYTYSTFFSEYPFPNPIETAVHNFLMLQGMGLSQTWSWNDPAWSISVELFASLAAFPFILRCKSNATLMAIACVGYGMVTARHHHLMAASDLHIMFFSSGLIKCVAGMSVGVMIKNLVSETTGSRVPDAKQSALQIAVLGMVSYFLFTTNDVKSYDLLALTGIAYIIYSSCVYDNFFARFVSSKVMVYLGKISFSIYLVHEPIMVLLGCSSTYSALGFAAKTTVFVSILAATSIATYSFVEMPSYSFLKRLIDRGVISKQSSAAGA
ncbi:acyltransferase family protein [Pantoea vagans]|uniref:acyltransferase family protein n=1 Tax=Pantoea vagans TaxID=470934 RepID=UPI000660351D|nr:acyltransferase [Pantoea vagans]